MKEHGNLILDAGGQEQVNRFQMINEEIYRSLYLSSGIAILIVAQDGSITSANRAACNSFDMTEQEIQRIGSSGLVDRADPRLGTLLQQAKRTGQAAGELTLIRKNGLKFQAELSLALFPNSQGEEMTTMIIRDLTSQKLAEEKDLTESKRDEREDLAERKKLYEDLVVAKEKAEESGRLKSAFLANISHEIRTPMNGIMGFARILKDSGLVRPEQRKFVDIILSSGKRMLDTMNDLIDISRIEAGQLNVTSFNPSLQLNNLIEFFTPQAVEKGMELILRDPVPPKAGNIRADYVKLDSVLTNLIKNAIKFTHRGKIEVGCRLKGHFLEYYVRDTGIGVSPGKQKTLFKRFEQADTQDSKSFQGSGLGLAIAKAYVELMGGEIRVESREGHGSTFSFTIPFQKAEAPMGIRGGNEIAEVKEFPRLAGKKILVAEDDPFSLEMITYLLSKTGATLITARDGRETVDVFDHDSFDLVLLDIRLPGMNGYEILHEIRLRNQKVPVVAQSAYALSADIKRFKDEGFNDYVTKPVAREKLYGILDKYLSAPQAP
jgi:PAS domain S-box-containing protein